MAFVFSDGSPNEDSYERLRILVRKDISEESGVVIFIAENMTGL